MLTSLIALLSTSGLGSIIGLLGGLLNRKIDIQAKREDHDFELKKLNAQKEYLELEYKSRTEVATIEAEGNTEVAGYNALRESYNFAKTSKEDGFVDKISKIVRPFLTLAFFFFTVYIFLQLHLLMIQAGTTLDSKELFVIYKSCIEWIFFQGGVSIGWWFAMRPGKTPTFGR